MSDLDGIDGWTETALAQGDSLEGEVRSGKTLAVLSHASLLFGLPIFLLPLLMRDNRFALHHAKAAAVTYVLFMITAALTVLTCGLFFPAMLICSIPALVGIVRAANGKLAGTWGMGTIGEAILGAVRVPTKKLPPTDRHTLDDF